MDDLDLLATALDTMEKVLAGVSDEQQGAPTPCTEYEVSALQNHVIGWMQMFEAWANGRAWEGDADSYEASDPPAEFRALADSALGGWHRLGTDRQIAGMNATLPADFVLSMMITEYTVHGWDIAAATDQVEVVRAGFTESELERILARGEAMLSPEYRGPGKMFGERVEVPEDAAVLDRVVAWAGRDPGWR